MVKTVSVTYCRRLEWSLRVRWYNSKRIMWCRFIRVFGTHYNNYMRINYVVGLLKIGGMFDKTIKSHVT